MVIYLILGAVIAVLAFVVGKAFGAGPCANDIINAEKAREAREAAAKATKESERLWEDSRIRGSFYEEYAKTVPGKVLGYGDDEVLADLIITQRPKTEARLAQKHKAEQKVRDLDSLARTRSLTTAAARSQMLDWITIPHTVVSRNTFGIPLPKKGAGRARKNKKRA